MPRRQIKREFGEISRIWRCMDITKKTKTKLHETMIQLIFPYGEMKNLYSKNLLVTEIFRNFKTTIKLELVT